MQELPIETTSPRPNLRLRGFGREILETILLIGAIYALVNLATVRFIVEGPSMQPNFHTGQVLVVSRLNYMFSPPQRGEIVIFNAPGQPPEEPPYIKRVIGLPGETVEIRDTKVYVNNVELFEPYINEDCEASRCVNRTWTLGEDEYFVMGDNRNHSSDSRAFGAVPRERIIGEALIRYWPPSDWGMVSHVAYPSNPFVEALR
ncbi:MAG: signal peptidase I [Anaerolineae bacterium]|nr:signal peptidase I [Anaerolineae bacterium]